MTKTNKAAKKAAPKVEKTAKKAAKKAAPSTTLPSEGKKEEAAILPRGQIRLPDGSIRLKSGTHDLGRTVTEYDVAGAKIELKGKVLIANKDVNWLSMSTCQKCGTKRPNGVSVFRTKDAMVLFTYTCSNKKECDLGGITYVQVHSKGRFHFKD